LSLRLEHPVRGAQHLDDFLRRREEVAGVRPSNESETLDLAGIDRGEDLPDPAAERLPGDDRPVDPDLTEEQVEVVRVLFGRLVAVGPSAAAVAALIEGVHVEARAQRPG